MLHFPAVNSHQSGSCPILAQFLKGVTLPILLTIAFTSLACKVIEAIVKNKLLDHLIVNNLITPCQHGFVKKHYRFTTP